MELLECHAKRQCMYVCCAWVALYRRTGRKCGLLWFVCFYANASIAYVEALVVVLQTPDEQAMRVYVYKRCQKSVFVY